MPRGDDGRIESHKEEVRGLDCTANIMKEKRWAGSVERM